MLATTVMQPFLVSSDTNFVYHPSTYSNSLEGSCFLAKWLILHKKQLLADLCGLLQSYSSSLMSSKHSSHCLHFLARFYIGHDWTQLVLPEALLICCFCSSIIPTYCVLTLTFHKGCAMSQSSDTADTNADEDVDVMLESICFSCPPTIVDEQCKVNVIVGVLIWKTMKSCVAHLWLTSYSGPMCKCLALIWNEIMSFSSSDFWNTEEFNMHIFWVFWNQENSLHSCNFSHQIFSNVRNPDTPALTFQNWLSRT